MLVIDHGQIIADDTAANLKATLAGDRITVTVAPADADDAAAIVAERGRDLTRTGTPGHSCIARFEQGTRRPGTAASLLSAGVEVRAADVRVPTLDDVFLALTGRSLREEVRGGGGMSMAQNARGTTPLPRGAPHGARPAN